ncbi:basic proline-rich protein-like [Ammospiza nelsoni]|uniref:basic proline-rich protein-like n=1 Tax=Ammospiza nelsoni TaxID=2857394 RepID=UPI002869DD49|nr:basic proline-rich protein-like [Ammospiza nelsoni]
MPGFPAHGGAARGGEPRGHPRAPGAAEAAPALGLPGSRSKRSSSEFPERKLLGTKSSGTRLVNSFPVVGNISYKAGDSTGLQTDRQASAPRGRKSARAAAGGSGTPVSAHGAAGGARAGGGAPGAAEPPAGSGRCPGHPEPAPPALAPSFVPKWLWRGIALPGRPPRQGHGEGHRSAHGKAPGRPVPRAPRRPPRRGGGTGGSSASGSPGGREAAGSGLSPPLTCPPPRTARCSGRGARSPARPARELSPLREPAVPLLARPVPREPPHLHQQLRPNFPSDSAAPEALRETLLPPPLLPEPRAVTFCPAAALPCPRPAEGSPQPPRHGGTRRRRFRTAGGSGKGRGKTRELRGAGAWPPSAPPGQVPAGRALLLGSTGLSSGSGSGSPRCSFRLPALVWQRHVAGLLRAKFLRWRARRSPHLARAAVSRALAAAAFCQNPGGGGAARHRCEPPRRVAPRCHPPPPRSPPGSPPGPPSPLSPRSRRRLEYPPAMQPAPAVTPAGSGVPPSRRGIPAPPGPAEGSQPS